MESSRDHRAYADALAFLFSRLNYERLPHMPHRPRDMNLARTHRLLQLLGNPHHGLPVLHIAGTKGKGSTAALLSSVLSAAGYRTGLYTSPHLNEVEERFVVGGRNCDPEKMLSLIEQVRPAVERLDRESVGRGLAGPTYFEITTALAFLYFRQAQVDLAVVEVGLGGRLDSTNVCQPLVAVITSISYDHTRQLGNTLAAIATEKAGIIKPGVPVVSGATDLEALAAIDRIARQRGSKLLNLNVDFRSQYIPPVDPLQNPSGKTRYERLRDGRWTTLWDDLEIGLLGEHQAANAAVAIAALEQLPPCWKVSAAAIREGLASAYCPARIEIVGRHPTTVLDVAHNVASIEALVRVMQGCFRHQERLLVLAATRDKDIRGMLHRLLPCFDRVVCTRSVNNPRGVDPEELQQLVLQMGVAAEMVWEDRVRCCPDPATAWQTARDLCGTEGLICVTGSFFIAAEIRALLRDPDQALFQAHKV
jgi:dihydrofolate synthase/folylpolyglutamate synthase